jgi:hypothetical protein
MSLELAVTSAYLVHSILVMWMHNVDDHGLELGPIAPPMSFLIEY